jgi:peptide/nickel transport system permease protein
MRRGLLRRMLHNKGAAAGALFLSTIVFIATLFPIVIPTSPWKMQGAPFLPPLSEGFILGTDMLGRDVALGLIHGARFSLLIGLLSTSTAILIGISIGAVAGFFRGWVDSLFMSFTELFQVVPGFVLIIVMVTVVGPSMSSVIIGIGLVSWPNVARIARAEVLSLRTRQFVDAARTAGQRPLKILLSQVLPNAMSSLIVVASVMVASAILAESGLSFLGLGDPNVMTWGYMIGAARPYLRDAWELSTIPGVAIMLTVMSLNLIGDGLTTALDPRYRPQYLNPPQ